MAAVTFKSRWRLGGAFVAAVLATVGTSEGLRTVAYRDPVGIPTICYGDTIGVHLGDVKTVAQCKVLLHDRLGEFAAGLDKCVDPNIPDAAAIAVMSWSYNVGLGAACKSTLVKKLNTGDIRGACNELPKWNKAGGKTLQGLVIRRAKEQEICLSSLEPPRVIAPSPPPMVAEKPVSAPVEKQGFWSWLWSWVF